MILITIKHQDGEREYISYHCNKVLTEKQYHHVYQNSGSFNPLEEKILKDIWEDDVELCDDGYYWRDTSVVEIEDVRDLSKTRFETLIELGILHRKDIFGRGNDLWNGMLLHARKLKEEKSNDNI